MSLSGVVSGHVRRSGGVALLCGACALAGVGIALAISRWAGIPPSWMTRDLADITGRGSYLGLLSQIGVMAWTGAVVMCLWSSRILWGSAGGARDARFLLVSGLVTLLLLLDDAFMLHERILPRMQVPERVVLGAHLLVIGGWLWWFRTEVLASEVLLLGGALLFLGISAGVDQVVPFSEDVAFLEDSPKFLGILLWLAYSLRTAAAALSRAGRLPRAGNPL
jgi:hypothetical protein